MELLYAHWISELGGYAVVFGGLYLIGYAVIWAILTPRKRYFIQSGDIVRSIARKERKTGCGCGIFVACAKHSQEMAAIDEELDKGEHR